MTQRWSFTSQDNPNLVTQFLAGYTDGNPDAKVPGSLSWVLHVLLREVDKPGMPKCWSCISFSVEKRIPASARQENGCI